MLKIIFLAHGDGEDKRLMCRSLGSGDWPTEVLGR